MPKSRRRKNCVLRVHFACSCALRQALEDLCTSYGCSMGELIRTLVRMELGRHPEIARKI